MKSLYCKVDNRDMRENRKGAIVGMPRSGTTWVSKIVDSSPAVAYFHEPDRVRRIQCIPYVTNSADYMLWSSVIREFVDGIPDSVTARVWLKQPTFSKDIHGSILAKLQRIGFESRLRLDQMLAAVGVVCCGRSLPNLYKDTVFSLWKSVDQTGNIGCILRAVPEQKLLHVVRHPCGFVDSQLRGVRGNYLKTKVPLFDDPGVFDFVTKTSFATKIGLRSIDWLEMQRVERLSYIWLCLNEQAAIDGEGQKNYFQLCFDDLCRDTESIAPKIFDFFELPFGEQSSKFISESTRSESSSYYSVKRDSKSVPGMWEKNLAKNDIDSVLKVLALGVKMPELFHER